MKHLISLSIAALCLFSACSKAPSPCTPTPPTIIHASVIGRWVNQYDDTLIITKAAIQENNEPPYPYIPGHDTLYYYMDDLSVSPKYYYHLSRTADSLTLIPYLVSSMAPYYYRRF